MLARREHKNLIWVDLLSPEPAEVRALMGEFGLHPLIGEEMLSPSLRQRSERFGDFLYIVLRFPSFGKGRVHVERELDIAVGRKALITAHYEELGAVSSFAKTFEANAALDHGTLGGHSGHLLYLLLRMLYRTLADELGYVRDDLHHIEERIFKGREREMVVELSRASRIVLDFRRTLAAHRDVLSSLEATGSHLFGQEFSFYARLLQSEYLKVENMLSELRDSLHELRATNNSLLQTKQNETMKLFTVMAFITLPLTVITGLFSMNTVYTPFVGAPEGFWRILGLMAIVSVLLFVYFKFRKWL